MRKYSQLTRDFPSIMNELLSAIDPGGIQEVAASVSGHINRKLELALYPTPRPSPSRSYLPLGLQLPTHICSTHHEMLARTHSPERSATDPNKILFRSYQL